MPTCGRCARRNMAEQCVYHPAPLSKALPTPHTSEASPSPRPNLQICDTNPDTTSESLVTVSESAGRSNYHETLAEESLQVQPHSRSQRGVEDNQRTIQQSLTQTLGFSTTSQSSPGFLGATSYSAILAENETNIGITSTDAGAGHGSFAAVSQTHVQKGAEMLLLLKDMPLFDRFIDRWFSLSRGIVVIEPMVKQWAASLWACHHKVLQSQRPDSMIKLSEVIWLNTLNPLKFNGKTTPREFVAIGTGENLRWEVVGIIFSVVGMLAMTLLDGDSIFLSHDDEPLDRKQFALNVWNASEICLKFCSDFDVLNDLFHWLLYENTVLTSSLQPKGGYANWQKAGVLNNALLAFGLHQEIKVDADTPFFITEFRKKVFVSAYSNDKYMATFLGRPPRLTHRYCRIQLPLDLTDAQIMSDGLDLDNAIGTLDNEGWNQRGTIHRCTFARIVAQNARIREDILEISLGVHEQDIVLRAESIEKRAEEMWETLPEFLRLDSHNPWDIKRAPVELLFLVYVRLENLNHHFLLQRSLIKNTTSDTGKLLAIAKEIFLDVLIIVNNRDSIRDFQIDFLLILCTHGLPSSAVIAVELLRQEQNRGVSMNPLSRSDTIQDLSIFVGCLSSIRPDSGAYSICDRGRRFLKRILDTILSPATIAASSNLSILDFQDSSSSVPLFPGNDGDFMRWLETMEWEHENWTNFN